ncbi:MAG: MBL fold metallo-hydrolase, partial [Desulfosarcinaceae bacterium]
RLCVTALDVGQGTAHLLQLPGGFTALVDGGGFGDPRIFDVGEWIVAPLLWRNKIRTVDLVVLSHPNADHLNGLIFILEHFNIGEVWSNHQPADTLGYERWSSAIRSRGIVHRPFGQLPRRTTRGGVGFEILNPRPGFMERSREERWRDLNENSLVLKVSLGAVSFLFSGDIGRRTEAELVRLVGPGRLKSTVLFVPHHGSAGSSSVSFLKAVQPRDAVVSAGWQNIFHFPHVRTLARLDAAGAHAWRTDLCGAVTIVSDGADHFVTTCRPCRSAGK